MAKKEIDEISGIETTGHEWDGLKELNNPLPRWWLWVFYLCVAWSLVYYVFYPSWPLVSDYTRGMLGHSNRADAIASVAQQREERAARGGALANASLEEIAATPELLEFALANGRSAFAQNCAACHGAGATGAVSYPNLNDDDWLWGGTLEDIHQTITHGVRWEEDFDTRFGNMTAFGRDGILNEEEITNVAAYVRTLSGLQPEEGDATAGEELFVANCAVCHGEGGVGQQALGAPNLTDGIWLYGSDQATIMEGVTNGRGGVMPAMAPRFNDDGVTVKSLAIYVHSLGGGQ